jgi:hypothetical protein
MIYAQGLVTIHVNILSMHKHVYALIVYLRGSFGDKALWYMIWQEHTYGGVKPVKLDPDFLPLVIVSSPVSHVAVVFFRDTLLDEVC